MLKKTIKYVDLEGNPVEDDFYFHLSINDLLAWNEESGEGLLTELEAASNSDHAPTVLAIFRKILARSVGRKTADGKAFERDAVTTSAFINSDAYASLLFEMIRDSDSAAEFVNAVIPKNVRDRLMSVDSSAQLTAEATPKKLDDYTVQQLVAMPVDQFQQLVRSAHPGSMSKDVLVLALQRGVTIGK
jgi:hypothetical protein